MVGPPPSAPAVPCAGDQQEAPPLPAPCRLSSSSVSSSTHSMTAGGGGMLSNGGDVCRICHCESEPGSPLISPCVCSGSLKYVHQACLQQWIKSANTESCELCKYHFQMTIKVKPFRKVSSCRNAIFCLASREIMVLCNAIQFEI